MQLTDGEELLNLVHNAPIGICILDAATLVSEILNDAFIEVAGKPYEQLYGHYIWDAFAEVRHLFENDLARAANGETVRAEELEIPLIRNGKIEIIVINFVYAPVRNTAGKISKVAVWVLENTIQVKHRQQIQSLNEALAATNEELASTNEELTCSNEELQQTQSSLQELNEQLENTVAIRTQALTESEANTHALNEELSASNEELTSSVEQLALVLDQLKNNLQQLELSEGRFQNLVRDASVGIIVLTGENMDVMIVNDAYAKLIGRSVEELHHHPLFEIIPEAEGDFRKILDQVRNSGEPVVLYDKPYFVYTQGAKIQGYLNLVYQPFTDVDGRISGTMVLCQNVTEQVNAKRRLEQAEEVSRLSAEAANLGTYLLDSETQFLVFSPRAKQLLGYDADEEISFDAVIGQITENYRQNVLDAINATLTNREPYNIEYTIIKNNDQTLHWIKALGGMYLDGENYTQFYGVLMDITEQKQDEQRKNDFIGMVSHELKTPLTSLNGYIQLLKGKAAKLTDPFTIAALDKSAKQVKKMTTLINGFLNLSRLESGKIYIEKQVFDMAELVREVEEEIKDTVSSHEIVFAPVKPTIIFADRNKIGQVLNNYISNAIKYSPVNSTINVACITVDRQVQVSVQDQGAGIAQEDLGKLFERFYRVKSSHNIAGFGIGLYLCQEIIQRHQGRNWVESEVGKGSTFYYSLPVLDKEVMLSKAI